MLLHDYELSASCYAVRLFAALAGLELDFHPVELYPARESEAEAYLAIDPLGRVPALIDGDLILADTGAILTYLALQPGSAAHWHPNEGAAAQARLLDGLALADRLAGTAGLARLHDGFGVPADVVACRADACAVLHLVEARLWHGERAGRPWLLGTAPSIADIALFPHAALAEEGGIALRHYPALRRWLDRVRALPGFVEMPGVFGL